MLLPSRQDYELNPFSRCSDKQVRVFLAKQVEQLSYGQIALREGVRCRKSVLSTLRRAIANIERSGWRLVSPLALAA